ncbi:MAG: hypothetical protein ABI903_00125 [Actinomycetota bacterium]
MSEDAEPQVLDDVAQMLQIGDLRPSRNRVTSGIEETVRAHFVKAGYAVPEEKMAVVCRHPDPKHKYLSLTPDVVLVEHKIAVEVDPCGVCDSSRGTTHRGEEGKDRIRNDLFNEAGWTVIRLRLGATKGMHIGKRDVVVESSGFTAAAQVALLEAVDDAISKRRARVRVVKKGESPTPSKRKLHVMRITPFNYADGGHIFSWYPFLETNEKEPMRLAMDGRFLYTHQGMGFVAEVRLHELPLDQWREHLTDFLRDVDPQQLGTTKWPWGETLFVSAIERTDGNEIVEQCERKTSIDKAAFAFTTNCDALARWDAGTLLDDAQAVIARLHDDAISAGYRIFAVDRFDGRYGPYQKIVVSRVPPAAK